MELKRSVLAVMTAGLALTALARADSAPQPNPFSKYADPNGVVLAVETPFINMNGAVRLTVYADEPTFLEEAAAKHQAVIDENGVAIMRLGALEKGDYAFVAYYDANGDGVLNRGRIIGRPKEPLAFSNGVKPRLRKPRFEETKVNVAPGSVVVLTIDD